jgi:integrase
MRDSNRLDPLKVASLVKKRAAGRHADGGGLYLVVDPSGASRWAFLFRWKPDRAVSGAGRLREMGLGSTGAVSLKRAREKAQAARAQVADGIDPISARRASNAVPTFGEVADELIASKTQAARGRATQARLKRALQVYAADLRPLRVDAVDTAAVLDVLKPIWTSKPETAQKTRGLIEAVLNAARAKGYRAGENPAAWRGHLDHLLSRPRLGGRHASLPYENVPEFIRELRGREAVAALALEFIVLTAARSNEGLGASWDEIDLSARIWTIPALRMKNGREHRVPLSWRTLEILETAKALRRGAYVFPSPAADAPMTGAALDRLRKRMKLQGATTHGFRSSFRDWCGDETSYPRELAEEALAHTIGNSTERAYRRSDALERRRELMDAWADYCSGRSGKQLKLVHG